MKRSAFVSISLLVFLLAVKGYAQNHGKVTIEGDDASPAQIGSYTFRPYAVLADSRSTTELDLKFFLKVSGDTIDCYLLCPDEVETNDNLEGSTKTILKFNVTDFDVSKYSAKLLYGHNHLMLKPRQRSVIKGIQISYFDKGNAYVRIERRGKKSLIFKGRIETDLNLVE
jgi:hypothetical protein